MIEVYTQVEMQRGFIFDGYDLYAHAMMYLNHPSRRAGSSTRSKPP